MAIRSYTKTASRPAPRGALGAAITMGERMPRTLPRAQASREALIAIGERPARLGPKAAGR